MKILATVCASLVLFCGCAPTLPTFLTPKTAERDVSPIQISPTYRTAPLALANLPADTALAMSGIVHLIRGEKPNVDHLTIAPSVNLTEIGVPLESFQFTGLTILNRIEKEVIKGQSWETKTMAVLTFELGPWRAHVMTEALTTTSSSGVVLNQAAVRTLSPALPRTVAWFVPKAAFQAAIATDKALPIWEVMDLANSMGVPIGADHPPLKGSYLAVVFVLDRLESGDSVKGWRSTRHAPDSTWSVTTPARYGIGFPIVMIDVDGSLNVSGEEQFIHVAWRSADKSRTNGVAMDVPIGRFSTAKAFVDTGTKTPAGTAATNDKFDTTTAKTSVVSSNTSNQRLLNIQVKSDAMQIQGQLKKLGFYAGDVDGDFGKGSQSALAGFRKAKGLVDGENWNIATQSALFGTSER